MKEEGRHVLLVEDETLVALSEAVLLQKNGYTVTTVYTGEEAVATVKRMKEIELVLMDLALGRGIDGSRAAEKILAFRNIPIIFLTCHAQQDFVARVRNIPHYGYVIKGSGEPVLLQSISRVFRQYDAEQAAEKREAEILKRERDVRSILKSVGAAVILTDFGGKICDMNTMAEKMTGWKKWDASGRSIDEVFDATESHGNDSSRECPVRRVLRTGKPVSLKNSTTLRSKYGKSYHINEAAIPIHDMEGNLAEVALSFYNMSSFRNMEKESTRKESMLQCVYELADIVSLPGMSLEDILKETARAVSRALKCETAVTCTIFLDGMLYRSSNTYQLNKVIIQQPVYVFGREAGRIELEYSGKQHSECVESRRQADMFLMQTVSGFLARTIERMRTEGDYRFIFEHIEEGILRTDKFGSITMVNPAGVLLFGYSGANEMCGLHMPSLFRDPAEWSFLESRSLRQGAFVHHQVTTMGADGREIFVSCKMRCRRDTGGYFQGTDCIFRPVSWSKGQGG